MDSGSSSEGRAGAARLQVSPHTVDTSSNAANPGQGLSTNEDSAILTGVDAVSPIASPVPPDCGDDNELIPARQYIFDNPQDYFSHRNDIVNSAIEECKTTLVVPNEDGDFVGSWILTEISYWDTEKERIVILTMRALIVVKYDFIAMKKKEFRRIPLSIVDTLAVGLLTYPQISVVPRINGITNGISTVVRDCILDRFLQSNNTVPSLTRKEEKHGTFDLKNFESRNREMRGIRLMWNQGQPLPFIKKWNPFDKTIPFITYASHPLFWHKGDSSTDIKDMYDIEKFSKTLIDTIEISRSNCKIHHAPILLENYIGLPSILHNKTSLGFFKIRGNFSF